MKTKSILFPIRKLIVLVNPKQLELAMRRARHFNVTVFICACTRFSPSLIRELQ